MGLKMLLINPPYHTGVIEASGTWLPTNLYYLAGALESSHEVRVFDAMNLFKELPDIEREIRTFKPDLVAAGTFTASHATGLSVLKLAKYIDKNIITVIGGLHPTFMYRDILEESRQIIDFAIRGEGEQTILDLANAIYDKTPFEDVKGIAFLQNDSVLATPQQPFLTDLEKFQPAWHMIDWSKYSYRPYRATFAVTTSSRGCVQDCSFCSQKLFWQQKWRGRKPEDYVREVLHLHKDYGVKVFMLTDEIPTYDRERWLKILELLIKEKLDIQILIETRVDDILRDEDILHLYRKANIMHIYVGVEAVDQATLDFYNKNIKVEDSKKALDLINKHDIITETSLVLGMPHDTKESFRKTLELAKYYDPDLAFFLALTPWPYSDIYEGLKPYIEEFDLSKYNLIEPIIKPTNMTLEEVRIELFNCFKDFYYEKIMNIDKMSDFKRHYMIEVTKLLASHSYLAEQMKVMFKSSTDLKKHLKMHKKIAKVLSKGK